MDYSRLKKYIINKLQQELPKELYYHQVEHSIQVAKDAETIGKAEGVSEHELLLLKTAGLLHDSGFLQTPFQNEPIGSEIAKKILPDYAYTPKEIEIISKMILSTAIPQQAKNLLEKIICDADLCYLGEKDAKTHADNLRIEMELTSACKFTNLEWIDFQLKFLKSHEFFTDYARKHIAPGKTKYIKALLDEKQVLEGE